MLPKMGGSLFRNYAVPNLTELVCDNCGRSYKTRSDRAYCSHFCSNSCWGQKCGGVQFEDLIGRVFGRWLVVSRAENTRQGSARWCVLCECGNISTVEAKMLRRGESKSCGCLKSEIQRELRTTHGMSRNSKFRSLYGRQYRDKKRHLDEWLPEHEILLFSIQKSCTICESVSNLAIDHVFPLSKGFGLKPGNAVVLCKSCNSTKSNRNLESLPLDWQYKIRKAAKEFEDAWEQKLLFLSSMDTKQSID